MQLMMIPRYPGAPLAALILVSTAFLLAAGCGGGGGAATVASTGGARSSEKPLPTPAPQGASQAQEQPGPYGPFSRSSQSVGMLIDGLQLKNIRWSGHGSFFRVVFEMATPDGKPLLQIPHAQASLSADGKQIKVVLGGIRSIGSSASAKATALKTGDSSATSINRLPGKDDQSLTYVINLSAPSAYALAGLGSPGRIVIDIPK